VLTLAAEGAIKQFAVVVFAAGIIGHASPQSLFATASTEVTTRCRGYIARVATRLQRRPAQQRKQVFP
jgi:hypothetical protein